MSAITVMIAAWKRPENMAKIVDALCAQTLRPRIFVWNNNPDTTCADPRFDLVVQSSRNLRVWPRWFLGSMADTDYICTLDDDLMPGDARVFEDFVRAMDEDSTPDRAYGFDGLVIPRGTTYCQANWPGGKWRPPIPNSIAVDVVKGQVMALRRTALARITMLPAGDDDDIIICGALAAGRAQYHRAYGWLNRRIRTLPEHDSMCREPGHFERRDVSARRYLHH